MTYRCGLKLDLPIVWPAAHADHIRICKFTEYYRVHLQSFAGIG